MNERKRVVKTFNKPSKTQQNHYKKVHLPTIMRNNGVVSARTAPPMFGDFTDVPDIGKMMEVTEKANKSFMALPAKVRAEFNNDPAIMARFAVKKENLQKCIELGIIKSKKPDVFTRMEKTMKKTNELLSKNQTNKKAAEKE